MLSHLYIVKSKCGLIKIGRSSCPKRRIAEIAKATGTAVVKQYLSPLCLNAQTIECHLHQHFAEYRQEGEWFQVDFQTAVKEAKRQTFETEEPGKLLTFEFESNQLRTMVDEKNDLWFCLKDACNILKIGNPSELVKRLKKSGVISTEVAFKRSVARLNFVDEANFYRVIFGSRKKEAVKFQDWVVEEVLPSIRKTGQYSLPKQPLKNQVEQIDFEKFIEDCSPINQSGKIKGYLFGLSKLVFAEQMPGSDDSMGRNAIEKARL